MLSLIPKSCNMVIIELFDENYGQAQTTKIYVEFACYFSLCLCLIGYSKFGGGALSVALCEQRVLMGDYFFHLQFFVR